MSQPTGCENFRLAESQPKVEELDPTLHRDSEVFGLDVAMNKLVGMRIGQTERRLANDLAGVFDRDAVQPANEFVGVESVDVFHHQVVDFACETGIKRLNDVGGVDASDRAHLTFEAFDRAGSSRR